MKHRGFFMLLIIALLSGITAMAQLTMFEGKILGEDGMPLKGAIIQLKWKGDMIETRSDNDGLFYTTLIPTGMYKIGVEADGKYYKLRGLKVLPSDAKKYYYVHIHGGRLFVDVEGMDPFLKSKMSQLLDEDPKYDVLVGDDKKLVNVKIDTATGKGSVIYNSPNFLPPQK